MINFTQETDAIHSTKYNLKILAYFLQNEYSHFSIRCECESWLVTKQLMNNNHVFVSKCLRRMLKIIIIWTLFNIKKSPTSCHCTKRDQALPMELYWTHSLEVIPRSFLEFIRNQSIRMENEIYHSRYSWTLEEETNFQILF